MFLATAGWFRYNDLLYFDLPGTLASRSKDVFYLVLLKRKRSPHVCRLPVKLAFHELSLYSILLRWANRFGLHRHQQHQRHLFLRQIDYRKTRGQTPFVKTHKLMRRGQFEKSIHNCLTKCGYSTKGVTTHGCRRGGLSSARRNGVESDICMLYGMWRNQCSILGYDDLLGDRLTRTTEQF